MDNQLLIMTASTQKLSLSTTKLNLVIDGDSLTQGAHGNGNQDYPLALAALLSPLCQEFTLHSFGVSGQSILDMLSDAATQIYPLADANKTNLLIGWEDVNAILNDGRTAQQTYNDHVAYFSGAKAAGFQYCLLLTSYYPRLKNGVYNGTPPWNSTVRSEQKAFFDLVKFNPNTAWNQSLDLRLSPDLGGDEGQAINSNFSDSVHLVHSGYATKLAPFIFNNGVMQFFTL